MYFKGQRFDYGDASKIRDIINGKFIKSLGVKQGQLEVTSTKDRDSKIRSVFIDFLGLMMDDLIENNNIFKSPNAIRFEVKICEKGPKETEKLLDAKWSYQDVNILASDGKFYHFVITLNRKNYRFYRPLRISHHRYKKLVEKVNSGMRYHKEP